jgi:SAM-dependent methyltransferase
MSGMQDPFSRTAAFFDELVVRHGATFDALDYGSEATQRTRFEVIVELVDFTGRSVLDVGCGLAHFADFLESRQEGVRYTGIDVAPRMVEAARVRRPDLDLRYGNVLALGEERFDIVVANGIFYLLDGDAPAVMQRIVGAMWEHAMNAVVFTSLSTWGGAASGDEFRADPVDTLRFCGAFAPSLVLRHDYLPHDFAVCLRHA